MKKVILILMILGSSVYAEKYVESIGGGFYRVFKNEGQSIRSFNLERDGYINIVPTPSDCMQALMLMDKNYKVIRTYQIYREANINEPLKAGKYYIQVVPRENKDCSMNVALPW